LTSMEAGQYFRSSIVHSREILSSGTDNFHWPTCPFSVLCRSKIFSSGQKVNGLLGIASGHGQYSVTLL
jgi:hypothetical protein